MLALHYQTVIGHVDSQLCVSVAKSVKNKQDWVCHDCSTSSSLSVVAADPKCEGLSNGRCALYYMLGDFPPIPDCSRFLANKLQKVLWH